MPGPGWIKPWTPADSLAITRVIGFFLTYDWNPTLLREILGNVKDGELKAFAEEMSGYRPEHGGYLRPGLGAVLNDEEAKEAGVWHEEALMDRRSGGSGSQRGDGRTKAIQQDDHGEGAGKD